MIAAIQHHYVHLPHYSSTLIEKPQEKASSMCTQSFKQQCGCKAPVHCHKASTPCKRKLPTPPFHITSGRDGRKEKKRSSPHTEGTKSKKMHKTVLSTAY